MKILLDPFAWLTIIFTIILIYSFLRIYYTRRKLDNSEKYINTLQILHDDIRCFKHDYDNIVTTIGGYIASDDMEGLKDYYSHLQKDCKDVNNLYLLNPKVINDPGVYSLLVDKYAKAKKSGIKIALEFLLDMDDLEMNIYEFTRILGILLDNSIEAAKESSEKQIHISFRNDFNKKQQVVIIENSYKNKNVDIDTIFDKSKTDKKNHSGLGLFEVKRILCKHNNLNLYTTKDNKLFRQQLEIFYN